MRNSIRTLPAAWLVASLAAALGTSPAAATVYRDSSAGAACHAANGALAAKFTFNLNNLTNIGTTDAYVICHLPMDDGVSTPDHITALSVDLLAPVPGTTVTCVAQLGAYYDGVNHVYYSSSRSYTTVATNEAVRLEWYDNIARAQHHHVLTINCKLPPNAKMGLITRWETQLS